MNAFKPLLAGMSTLLVILGANLENILGLGLLLIGSFLIGMLAAD